MALAYFGSQTQSPKRLLGLAYAWSGFAVMWGFWICFVIFLADPPRVAKSWPLPTVDNGGAIDQHGLAALIDLVLTSLLGLQHSLMARPWFKQRVLRGLPPAFERCTFVHAANLALLALIIFWQPIPMEIWSTASPWREVMSLAFAAAWMILLLGALSFGIRDLLGIEQMHAWADGAPPPKPRLKTGFLYRWLRHPMYVGVLLAMWATPQMTLGHLLLATGMTLYVLIAMRYEVRDLLDRFGSRYDRWRSTG
jgi:protein-S-isoprenylcysteine O-methyltransferase Ste14